MSPGSADAALDEAGDGVKRLVDAAEAGENLSRSRTSLASGDCMVDCAVTCREQQGLGIRTLSTWAHLLGAEMFHPERKLAVLIISVQSLVPRMHSRMH